MSDLCGGLASNEFQINFFICEHSHIWSFNLCSNYFQQTSRKTACEDEANGLEGFEILILVLIGSEADDKKVHVRTFISPALRASFRNVLARGPDNSSGNGAIMCDK